MRACSRRSCGHALFHSGCSSVMFPVGWCPIQAGVWESNRLSVGRKLGILWILWRYEYCYRCCICRWTQCHAWAISTHTYLDFCQWSVPNNTNSAPSGRCPCDEGNTYGSPPFVGNDYFCDSVATPNDWHIYYRTFFPNNALWDGQLSLNTCYNNENDLWFTKTLSTPTADDIELRMCFNRPSTSSNIGLQLMEIYIS